MINSIKWFNLPKDKHLMKFVMFDIKEKGQGERRFV